MVCNGETDPPTLKRSKKSITVVYAHMLFSRASLECDRILFSLLVVVVLWWFCYCRCRLNSYFLCFAAGPSVWSLCHDMSTEVSDWTKNDQKTVWALSQHSHANSTFTNRCTKTRKYVCKCHIHSLYNELQRNWTKLNFIPCYRRELVSFGSLKKPQRQHPRQYIGLNGQCCLRAL